MQANIQTKTTTWVKSDRSKFSLVVIHLHTEVRDAACRLPGEQGEPQMSRLQDVV